jgi:serine/threonine protein kinase
MDGGSVAKLLRGHGGLPEPNIAYVLSNVTTALVCAHNKNVTHRDVKCDNVLLNREGECKLGDFGLALELVEVASHPLEPTGTTFWMAPEVFLDEQTSDTSADVWALGITAIELAETQAPMTREIKAFVEEFAMNNDQIEDVTYQSIVHGIPPTLEQPERWSEDFKDFLSSCLQKDPAMRATAEELQDHPFLAKACSKQEFAAFLMDATFY